MVDGRGEGFGEDGEDGEKMEKEICQGKHGLKAGNKRICKNPLKEQEQLPTD